MDSSVVSVVRLRASQAALVSLETVIRFSGAAR